MLDLLRGWLVARGHIYGAATIVTDMDGFTLERERAPAVRVPWADIRSVRVRSCAEPGVPVLRLRVQLRRGREISVFDHWEGFDEFVRALGRDLGRPDGWWDDVAARAQRGLEISVPVPGIIPP